MAVLKSNLEEFTSSSSPKRRDKMKNVISLNEFKEFKDKIVGKPVYDKEGLKRAYLQELLDEYGKDYVKNVFYTFSRCTKKEMREDEDLCKFNEKQLEEMLREANYTSLSAITSDVSKLAGYIDFCNRKNAVATQYNLLREMPAFRFENLKKFINVLKGIEDYFSPIRINRIIKATVNPVDQAAIGLLAEGIRGTEMSEVINLTVDDIDWENGVLTLRDIDGTISREREVSGDLLKILRAASKQRVYYTKNGNATSHRDKQDMLMDKHIIRRTAFKSVEAKVDKTIIETRLRVIKRELDQPRLLNTNIYESSIINKTLEIMKERDVKVEDEREVLHCIYKAFEWAGKTNKAKAHIIRKKIEMITRLKDEYKGYAALENMGLY